MLEAIQKVGLRPPAHQSRYWKTDEPRVEQQRPARLRARHSAHPRRADGPPEPWTDQLNSEWVIDWRKGGAWWLRRALSWLHNLTDQDGDFTHEREAAWTRC